MREPMLYVHARPHIDESCSSWLIRTAEIHGVTAAALLRALKVVKRRDLDVAVTPRIVSKFTRGMDYPVSTVRQMSKFFEAFRTEKWARAWLKLSVSGMPLLGYCPHCLDEDEHPYWRSTWRFKYWVVCPLHGAPILNVCMACERPLGAFDYHEKRPVRAGESLCGCCPHCRIQLRNAVAGSFRYPLSQVQSLIDLQHVVTAALLRGSFRLVGLDQDIPLALLPSVVMAGGTRGDGTSPPIERMATIEICEAIRALRKGGVEGFFVDSRSEFVSVANANWKGSAHRLAEFALWTRFSLFHSFALSAQDPRWNEVLLRQIA